MIIRSDWSVIAVIYNYLTKSFDALIVHDYFSVRLYVWNKVMQFHNVIRHICHEPTISCKYNDAKYGFRINAQEGLHGFYVFIILMNWVLKLEFILIKQTTKPITSSERLSPFLLMRFAKNPTAKIFGFNYKYSVRGY